MIGIKWPERGVLGAKQETAVSSGLLFVVVCNVLIMSVLLSVILSDTLNIDFPRAILVGPHAFDDSFLA